MPELPSGIPGSRQKDGHTMRKMNLFEKAWKSLALPGVIFLIFAVISLATGNSFLSSSMLLYTMRLSCVTLIIALAISFQIINGVFDFSTGAIVYLSAIIGCNIAVTNKLGAGVMALIIIGVGILLGLINGILYVTLRLPPRVVSLATVMIYEAVTQIYRDGKGVMITTKPQYAIFSKQPYIFIIAFVMILFYWALMKYTRFGLRAKALSSGQKIAVDFGIREKANVLIRYAIFGLFLGVAAVLYLGQNLIIECAKDMTSTIVMFSSIMPVTIGLRLAKYSNTPIGILMAVLAMEFISVGFVCMGLDPNLASAVNGLFILFFIAYTGNLPAMANFFHRKKRRAELTAEFADAGYKETAAK